MTNFVLQAKSGPDGVLHLEVPASLPDAEYDVEIVLRLMTPAEKGWPPGYSELFGSIDDETFTVHPQPPMPPPVSFD